jgi:hypothetical protein
MKRPASEVLDISRWPSIDINALKETARDRYQQRATAIEHYANRVPIGEVQEKTKLDRRVLYRMIERALQAHPDGRPWGFRALVPGSHTKAYRVCHFQKTISVEDAALAEFLRGGRKMSRLGVLKARTAQQGLLAASCPALPRFAVCRWRRDGHNTVSRWADLKVGTSLSSHNASSWR